MREWSNLALSIPEPDAGVVQGDHTNGDREESRRRQHSSHENAAAEPVVRQVGEVAAHEEPVGQHRGGHRQDEADGDANGKGASLGGVA